MKLITYTLYFLLLSNLSFGQYLPIINSDNTWISITASGFEQPFPFQYTYSEDSVSQTSGYYFERILSTNEDGSDPFIEGYYREIDGMIYKKLEGDFNERLILDMSLIEGDSIDIEQDWISAILVVVEVDTIMYDDGVPRTRIELKCSENPDDYGSIFWVEGIGELFTGIHCVLDGGDSFLNCVIGKNGELIYHVIEEDECWFETSLCNFPDYEIGDSWTYETVYYVSEDYQQINYATIEIIDTMSMDGHFSYRLSNTDIFYEEDDKMYFWDEGLDTFELYYDFKSTEDYSIRYYDQFSGDTSFAEIKIDSVYEVTVNGMTIGARNISVFGSQSHPPNWKGIIYDNIGIGWDGPKIDLDCGLCDPETFTQDLRCFESSACLLNFKEYPCDSTFVITSTEEEKISTVAIYPNPTQNTLHIKSQEIPRNIEIYSVDGSLLLKHSNSNKISVRNLKSGVYVVKLEFKTNIIVQYFIKA